MTDYDPRNMPCARCATTSDLNGESRTQAVKKRIIAQSSHHDFADCIRVLRDKIDEVPRG